MQRIEVIIQKEGRAARWQYRIEGAEVLNSGEITHYSEIVRSGE